MIDGGATSPFLFPASLGYRFPLSVKSTNRTSLEGAAGGDRAGRACGYSVLVKGYSDFSPPGLITSI